MNAAITQTLMAILVLPMAAAVLIGLARHRPQIREAITLAVSAILLARVISLLEPVMQGARPELHLLTILPGLELALRLEPLGMLFALIASGLWLVNSVYAIGYMRANQELNQTRFYVFFALAIAATMGIAMAGNFFTLFLFYELLTLLTYPLVTHHGTPQAVRGGRVYLGLLMGTSILLLLPALIYLWFATGTTDFTAGGILAGKVAPQATLVLLILCMFGLGKAALMPFHRWLPAAMVAPTPVSALLHAVAVVKAGVFTVIKLIVYIFGLDTLASLGAAQWLVFVAGFTIIAASVVALRSDNLKRRLAYSTISQLAYVVMACALLTPLAVIGATLHLAVHALGKITLFFAAGAIYTSTHKTEVSELQGMGRRMPLTMSAFAIASLSMIGLPPVAGFLSKWYMLSGAMTVNHWFAVSVMALSTLLNAGYFLPIVYQAFFRQEVNPQTERATWEETPWPMLLALCSTACGTVALFFFPDMPLALAQRMLTH